MLHRLNAGDECKHRRSTTGVESVPPALCAQRAVLASCQDRDEIMAVASTQPQPPTLNPNLNPHPHPQPRTLATPEPPLRIYGS